MTKYNFTKKAAQDLAQIWLYHAEYSLDFADSLENLIYETASKIAENPNSYQKREDLTSKPYRFCVVDKYSYFIIYNPNSKPINILRILSSKRDIKSTLHS